MTPPIRTFLLALAASALACSHAPERPAVAEADPLAATVVAAAPSAVAGSTGATGLVEPWRRAMPSTLLMGRVESILKREGDRVRRGETLARIDARDVDARKAQADAALSAARAAEANARAMRERMERLEARQAASRKNVEDAVLAHEAALAQRRAAEQAVAAASIYSGDAKVQAPFDGVVTARHVEAGDMAAPGASLFTLEDLSKVKVEATVAESAAAALAPGNPVEVRFTTGIARTATITEILPATDPRSRTVVVRVVLDNVDGALRSGSFARLALPGPEGGAAGASVPESAVVRRGPLTGLFVAEAGIARLRWVTLGAAREGSVEVLTGLAAGERVVAPVPPSLEDGRRLTEAAR
ncbi:MAG TPA: efflux RND transporter periplasmic adaptor subunit [Candidatus Polarisedimenticolaceae bacterium]